MEIVWVKLSTEIFNNRKIKQILHKDDGDSIFVIWINLLTLAGKVNDDGKIYITEGVPYTAESLASQFERPPQLIQDSLDLFQKYNMICVSDEEISIKNWEKYQNIEGMEKIREQNRIRKQNQRQREKENCASRDCHVTVTQQKRKEKNRDREENTYMLTGTEAGERDIAQNDSYSDLLEKLSPNEKADAQAEILNRFSVFWNAYPRKVGKKAAIESWKKLKPSKKLLEKMLSAIEQQKQTDSWQKENGKFIPYAASWLNGERWEDEIQKPQERKYKERDLP